MSKVSKLNNIGNFVLREDCCGCEACSQSCQFGAIQITIDKAGFRFPTVDVERCKNCQKCIHVCPILNSKKINYREDYFFGYSKDVEICKRSASGGLAYELYYSFLCDRFSTVYGVAYKSNKIGSCYIRCDNKEELHLLQGSKYTQAEKKDIFKTVQFDLDSQKRVLFIGTPCEVAGLKTFLIKEYSKLYTVQLICHGITSEKMLRESLTEFGEYGTVLSLKERKGTSNIDDPNFEVTFERKRIEVPYATTMYSYVYSNVCRLSCYSCKFKGKNRVADLTIGDYWGSNFHNNKYHNKYGISVFTVHTNKGKELIDSVNNIESYKADSSFVEKHNSYIYKSKSNKDSRKKFLEDYSNGGMIFAFKKNAGIARRVINKTIKYIPLSLWSGVYSFYYSLKYRKR